MVFMIFIFVYNSNIPFLPFKYYPKFLVCHGVLRWLLGQAMELRLLPAIFLFALRPWPPLRYLLFKTFDFLNFSIFLVALVQ